MSDKTPELDTRGTRPINKAARGERQSRLVEVNVDQQLYRFVERECEKRGSTVKQLAYKMFIEAAKGLGAEDHMYDFNLGWSESSVADRYVELELSDVALDECDFPGVTECVELGELDPYYTTYAVGAEPDLKPSWKARSIQKTINDAAKAIERASSMRSYTSVVREGRISKAEARKEIREVLRLLPADLGEELWGWCGIADIILVAKRYQAEMIRQLEIQMKIEMYRQQAYLRRNVEAIADQDIEIWKAGILERVRQSRRSRPDHGGQWPTWAGQLESYLDHAAAAHMVNDAGGWYDRKHIIDQAVRMNENDEHELTTVQDTCTIDLSKGLTDEV